MIKKYFKIGEVMQYSGLSRQVVHNYTQLELIFEAKRTPSGHRLYSEETFDRIKKIKKLQSEGKTLLEIRRIINGRR